MWLVLLRLKSIKASAGIKTNDSTVSETNALGVDIYWKPTKEDKDGKIGFDGWKPHGKRAQTMTCSKLFGVTLTKCVVTMARKQAKSDTQQSSSKKRPTLT